MHYGFRIIDDMTQGLSNWMDEKSYATLSDFQGKAIPNYVDWGQLDINYELIAKIDQNNCIQCGLCHIACEGHLPPGHCSKGCQWHPPLRSCRRRMRRLQFVHACLSGRQLHHYGSCRQRQALHDLGRRPAQPGQSRHHRLTRLARASNIGAARVLLGRLFRARHAPRRSTFTRLAHRVVIRRKCRPVNVSASAFMGPYVAVQIGDFSLT